MSVHQLEQAPKLGRLYARAALTARGRHGDRLPEIAYTLPHVTIDPSNLASYADVCGFRQSDVLPPTYPHILGFPAAVMIMVDPAFPFALPGLVHVNNRITQQRPLHAGERLSISVRAMDLRDHPRGRQFDMITEVSAGGEPAWSEVSTYLHRERRPDSPSKSPSADREFAAASIWRIPAGVGRRYAAVSGDVNPIHMNPLAARLFGFPRAIAHGMWVKARCLAALEGRLADQLTADVEFKSPLLLPSTVAFTASPLNDEWTIGVKQARGERPHLIGRIANRSS